MVPSAEEVFYFLYKDEFLEKKSRLGPKESVLDYMTVNEISKLGNDLLEMGAAIAMVKCGNRGLYIRTSGQDRLEKLGAAKCADIENWLTVNSGFRYIKKKNLLVLLAPVMQQLRDFFPHLSGTIQ